MNVEFPDPAGLLIALARMADVEELDPSELGTMEYWTSAYKQEVQTFSETGDPGEVWFGEAAGARMVQWLERHPEHVRGDALVLDVGCGNGVLSVDLAREGFEVVGVDYCLEAVILSRQVAEKEGQEVTFEVCDILEDPLKSDCQAMKRIYDVVVDKGTFDAISLGETALDDKRTYVKNVASVLEPEGLLLITSCNWTEEELTAQFCDHFTVHSALPTPSFSFGGQTGHNVTTVVFRKVKS